MTTAEGNADNKASIKDTPEVVQRVREGLELVQQVAGSLMRTLGPRADYDEFVSCGQAALLDVARRYDPAIGASFKTFARSRIEGAMRDSFRAMCGLPSRRLYERLSAESVGSGDEASRQERDRLLAKHFAGIAAAQADGLLGQLGLDTQGEFMAVSPRSTAEDRSHRKQVLEQLDRCIATLPAQEAALIRRMYFDGGQLDDAAREIGVSKSWASRLHDKALARLKKRFK